MVELPIKMEKEEGRRGEIRENKTSAAKKLYPLAAQVTCLSRSIRC